MIEHRLMVFVFALLSFGVFQAESCRVFAADEIDPPPPPPAPAAPTPTPSPTNEEESGGSGSPALDRYQDCFQQMIDSGASDNSFMRKCLGIEETKPAEQGGTSRFTADEAAAVIESSVKPLEICYNQLLERSQALHLIPEGVVDPVLTIGNKGAVSSVNYQPTQFMDLGLLECLKQKLMGFSFKKASAGTVIKTSLRLSAVGTKRVGKVSLMKGYPKLSGPAYELSSKDILAVFRKYAPRVRACYDDLLKKTPNAGGTVGVDLVVLPIGKVKKVNFRENTISDRKFKTCVTTQLKTFRFPKMGNDDEYVVKYPEFIFSPRKK